VRQIKPMITITGTPKSQSSTGMAVSICNPIICKSHLSKICSLGAEVIIAKGRRRSRPVLCWRKKAFRLGAEISVVIENAAWTLWISLASVAQQIRESLIRTRSGD
jgi:hypothetical protein